MKTLKLSILLVILAAMALQVNAASISVQKEVTPLAPNTYHRGEKIYYVIQIVNPSTAYTLTVNSVTDTLPDGSNGTGSLVGPTPPYILAAHDGSPGGADTASYTLVWTVPVNAQGGLVVNTVNASGVQNSPIPDAASGVAQKTSLIIVPCVEVTKTVVPLVSKAGDDVTYTIAVRNCGDPNIYPVSVIDSIMGDLSQYYVTSPLKKGQSESHDFLYTVDLSDPDPLVNVVDVNYVDVTGFAVTDKDDASVDLVHPDFTVTKSCMEIGPVEPNSSVIFRVTITNTGDVALNFTTNEFEIPPFTLDSNGVKQQDIARIADVNDVFNSITVTATLPAQLNLSNVIGPKEANDICPVEPAGGATRTLGFWKTHCEYTEHVFEEHCGGTLNLGWLQVTNIEDLLGVLFANTAKISDGKTKRDALCQARVIASKQAVVALLNDCLDNGAALPKTPQQIAAILSGTDKNAISKLGSLLDTYNNSGDDIAIIDSDGFIFGNATPRDCKGIARIGAADCTTKQRVTALKLKR